MSLNRSMARPLLLATAAVLLIGASVMPSAAFAQSTEARLQRLENELQTLNRAVYKGEMPPAGSLAVGENVSAVNNANTELRLQQLERELRTLTGRVEEQNYQLQQLETQNEMLLQLQDRIGRIEMMGGAASPASSMGAGSAAPGYLPQPGMATGSVSAGLEQMAGQDGVYDGTQNIDLRTQAEPATAPPSAAGQLGTLRQPSDQPVPPGVDIVGTTSSFAAHEGPVDLYENAFAMLRDRNYDQAEIGFKAFLEQYADHDLAANAQYWLGETYYVRNDFDRAARAFAEAYQKYPKGPKGPDNLLKLGMALSGLGKTQDACLTFGQLGKEYPESSQTIQMRAEQEMDKLNCSTN